MTMTKSCAMWNAHTQARRQQDKELDDTIRAEFPPGTRVRWTHTYDGKTREPVKREGIVSDFYGYGKVNVQIKKGGQKHCLYAYLLDIIEPAAGVGGTDGR